MTLKALLLLAKSPAAGSVSIALATPATGIENRRQLVLAPRRSHIESSLRNICSKKSPERQMAASAFASKVSVLMFKQRL
jgi:hypothetical protein